MSLLHQELFEARENFVILFSSRVAWYYNLNIHCDGNEWRTRDYGLYHLLLFCLDNWLTSFLCVIGKVSKATKFLESCRNPIDCCSVLSGLLPDIAPAECVNRFETTLFEIY